MMMDMIHQTNGSIFTKKAISFFHAIMKKIIYLMLENEARISNLRSKINKSDETLLKIVCKMIFYSNMIHLDNKTKQLVKISLYRFIQSRKSVKRSLNLGCVNHVCDSNPCVRNRGYLNFNLSRRWSLLPCSSLKFWSPDTIGMPTDLQF